MSDEAKQAIAEYRQHSKKLMKVLSKLNEDERRKYKTEFADMFDFLEEALKTMQGDNEYRYEKYNGDEMIDRLKTSVSASWHKEGRVKQRPISDEELKKRTEDFADRRAQSAAGRTHYFIEQQYKQGLITDAEYEEIQKQIKPPVTVCEEEVPYEDESNIDDETNELVAGNYHVIKSHVPLPTPKAKPGKKEKPSKPAGKKGFKKSNAEIEEDNDLQELRALQIMDNTRRKMRATAEPEVNDHVKMITGNVDLAQRAVQILDEDGDDDTFFNPHCAKNT